MGGGGGDDGAGPGAAQPARGRVHPERAGAAVPRLAAAEEEDSVQRIFLEEMDQTDTPATAYKTLQTKEDFCLEIAKMLQNC